MVCAPYVIGAILYDGELVRCHSYDHTCTRGYLLYIILLGVIVHTCNAIVYDNPPTKIYT